MEIPNTYERHRRYRLRQQRMQRLRRRTILTVTAVAALLVSWHVLARLAPDTIAPPTPAALGSDAARSIARSTAVSVNRMHAGLHPAHREDAKRAVRRLLTPPAATPAAAPPPSATPPAAATSIADSPIPPLHMPVPPLHMPVPPLHMPVEPQDMPVPPPLFPVAAPVFPILQDTPATRRVLPTAMGLPTGEDAPITRQDMRTGSGMLDILLIGVDSRLGNSRGRADALHLLTIDFDAPRVRITSIPRGTHSPLGYQNAASNIIANVRAARGREELQRRIARMCGRDRVPYYVEVGFSDAYGILELLGYDDPGTALQALRRRKGYQFGDHDRCYNQGMFIRAAMLRMLPLLEGATGELLLRAGCELMRTNLSLEQCRGIVYLLNDAGVATTPSLVEVTLRSPFRARIERRAPDPSLTNAAMSANADVSVNADVSANAGEGTSRAEARIRRALAEAARRAGNDRAVKAALWTMFSQHAWMQLPRGERRRGLRDSVATVLTGACTRLGDTLALATIGRILRADDRLFPAPRPSVPRPSASPR